MSIWIKQTLRHLVQSEKNINCEACHSSMYPGISHTLQCTGVTAPSYCCASITTQGKRFMKWHSSNVCLNRNVVKYSFGSNIIPCTSIVIIIIIIIIITYKIYKALYIICKEIVPRRLTNITHCKNIYMNIAHINNTRSHTHTHTRLYI